MIRYLSVIVTALGLSLASSQAAEPTSHKPQAPEAPADAVNWTGLYAGIHGSVTSGETGLSELARLNFPSSWDMNGGTLGVQVGYNHQINDVVLGIEADYALAGIEGRGRGGVVYFPGTPLQSEISGNLNIGLRQMITLRPRIGVAAGRSFVYATAGAVAADLEAHLETVVTSPFFGTQRFSDTTRNFVFGWTLGAGWEHAFTDKLSVKTEYLLVTLDHDQWGNTMEEAVFRGHFLRVGLNYRF
ncbi:outer membrane protein [Microvirga solisilvae]|uniref:outer membrane protein n=1 Tax=Microvirga solisilvae TaxID=2919498 RepID=UPI001FAE7547